jgi:chromatin structure-remodeling complex subunit RSC9
MVLSLKSGLVKEVEWALDRLVRLSHNDQFALKGIPGLLDALFEWPWAYVSSTKSNHHHPEVMFSVSSEEKQLRRFGLTSLFVLKNASVNDLNARELAKHPRTVSLVYNALMTLQPDKDSDCEFLINSIEILQSIAHLLYFPTPTLLTAIIHRLEAIIDETSNRSFLICCLASITALMQNMRNLSLFKADTSPSLDAAIRCLPLFSDVPLISVCLEYLYARLSHPPLLRTFLLHPSLINTLKVLASLIVSTQELEDAAIDPVLPAEVTKASETEGPDYEMSEEELARVVKLTEPQRSYEW